VTRITFVAPLTALCLFAVPSLSAQRALSLGAGWTELSTRTSGDVSSAGPALSLEYLSNPSDATVFTFARWPNASFGGSVPGATALSLENRWYPVDATGVAPFVVTGLGAFRYSEPAGLLTPEQTKWGFSYIAGFGLGTTLGDHFRVSAEGRIRSDDGDRNLEYRATVSYGVGPLRASKAVPGTIEPFVAWLGHLNGGAPYRASSPFGGVRFRRDLTPTRSIGVEIGAVRMDPAPGQPASAAATSTVYLMQPTYEFGLAPSWGRPYLALGPELAGFIDGPDAGLRGGVQAGLGTDVYLSPTLELGLLTRFSWFQSAAGSSQFGLMLGVALGPRLHADRHDLPSKVPDGE
jgi:hypothetical protein